VYISMQRFNAYKYHWSDKRVAVILEVNPASLDQVDPATRRTLCSYDYKDIEGFAVVCYHFKLLHNKNSNNKKNRIKNNN